MRLPRPRGPFSTDLFAAMAGDGPIPASKIVADEADLQISLWALYELHYRGFDDVDSEREWDPKLLAVRAELEERFEADVRELAKPLVAEALAEQDNVVDQLFQISRYDEGPSLPNYLQRRADAGQYREFLVQRSLYHLKESDPHAWAVPRLDGPAKVALAELQYDEFGAGVADQLHSHLFAEALEDAGLDRGYGAYIDVTPTPTLAVNNVMSLFGLHQRLLGACMGHLAAFEMTSSLPCRRYSQGAERLGLGPRVVRYFDEHVEADAVHEQLAARAICQALVDARPERHDDVLLGAAACVALDARSGTQMIEAWENGESSLGETLRKAA